MPPVFYSVSTGPASPDDPGKLCVPSCFRFLLIRTFVQDRVAYEVFIVAHFVFLVKIFEKIRFWLFSNSFFVFCQPLSLRPSPVRSFCTAERDFTSPLTLCQGVFRANLETRFALLFARRCQTISFSEQRGVILLAAPRFVKAFAKTRFSPFRGTFYPPWRSILIERTAT